MKQNPLRFSLVPLLLFLMPVAALAADLADTVDDGLNLWGMLQQGGWAMYPLALSSLVMFFLIFYGYRETTRAKFIPDLVLPQLSRLLCARHVHAANQLLQTSPTVLTRCLDSALVRARPEVDDA